MGGRAGAVQQQQHRRGLAIPGPACQIAAVFFALLAKVYPYEWIWMTGMVLLYGVFAFTLASAIHYVVLTGQRLKKLQAGH